MGLTNINSSYSNAKWTSGQTYSVNDILWTSANGKMYPMTCLVGHVAGTLSTDVALGYWQLASPENNYIINSNFDIWQRSTSSTIAISYSSADRMFTFRQGGVGGSTVSRQTVTSWLSTNSPRYCLRLQRDSGNALTNGIELIHALETVDSLPLQGKSVCFSFWVRAGTNYSGGAASFYVGIGTNIDLGPISAWTGTSSPVTGNFTPTTTWQKVQATGIISSTTNQIRWDINYVPSGTAGANDYIEIAQVMLNEGSAPAPFRTAGINIQDELNMCQRYYEIIDPYSIYGKVVNASTTTIGCWGGFKVTKRALPTLNTTAGNFIYFSIASNFTSTTVPTFNQHTVDGFIFDQTGFTGLTSNAQVFGTVSWTGSMAYSAEL
jgi:hypothetical protein